MISLAGCGDTGNVPKIVGSSAGTVLTSSDGKIWTSQVINTTPELNNVTFGNNLFVAVGAAGTIFTSPDGNTWTPQNSGTVLNLYGVTYGNGLYVAVGGSVTYAAGVILTSPDGITWTVLPDSSALGVSLNGVIYANNQFVAVGNNAVMTSATGAASTWNLLPTQSSGITGPTVDLYNVAYGNSLFITVGTYNTSTSSQEITYNGLIATSSNGSIWNILPYTSNYLSGVTYGGGQFVAVGREGSILTSPDGTTWTTQTAAPIANSTLTPFLISVIYTGSQFVAVGNYVGTNPSSGFILTSSDGKNWNIAATGTTTDLYGISYGVVSGVGTYVAVGGQ
jgi:hypothetical protein